MVCLAVNTSKTSPSVARTSNWLVQLAKTATVPGPNNNFKSSLIKTPVIVPGFFIAKNKTDFRLMVVSGIILHR
jgi:hypothetical protein